MTFKGTVISITSGGRYREHIRVTISLDIHSGLKVEDCQIILPIWPGEGGTYFVGEKVSVNVEAA